MDLGRAAPVARAEGVGAGRAAAVHDARGDAARPWRGRQRKAAGLQVVRGRAALADEPQISERGACAGPDRAHGNLAVSGIKGGASKRGKRIVCPVGLSACRQIEQDRGGDDGHVVTRSLKTTPGRAQARDHAIGRSQTKGRATRQDQSIDRRHACVGAQQIRFASSRCAAHDMDTGHHGGIAHHDADA